MLRVAPYMLVSLRKRTATLSLAPLSGQFQNAAIRWFSSSNDDEYLDYFNEVSNRPNRPNKDRTRGFDGNRPRYDQRNHQRRNWQNHQGQYRKHSHPNQGSSSQRATGSREGFQQTPQNPQHQMRQTNQPNSQQPTRQIHPLDPPREAPPTIHLDRQPQPRPKKDLLPKSAPQKEASQRLAQLISQLRKTTPNSTPTEDSPAPLPPLYQKFLPTTKTSILPESSLAWNSDLRILPRRDAAEEEEETTDLLNIVSRTPRRLPWSQQRGQGQDDQQQPLQFQRHGQGYQQQQRQGQECQQQQQQQRYQQYQRHPQYQQQQTQQEQQHRPRQQQDPQNRMRQHNNPFRGLPRRSFQDGLEFLEGRSSRNTDDTPKKNNAAQEPGTRSVTLPSAVGDISLAETASLFRIKADDLLEKLESLGTDTTAGKELRLDIDTLELLAMEFGIETVRVENEVIKDNEELLMNQRRTDNVAASFPPRPPVVCIMGHVDHGKTTLMDALRRRSMAQPKQKTKKTKEKQGGKGTSTDIAGTEAGGITQIISAFQVDVAGQDNKVTFLDTPGHAAFKSMRQSGSHAADVIVLVIAADDGVSEQTIEILDFYKSIVKGSNGGITMMVALNKIDKPGIDVDEARRRIENQLLEQEILCEGIPGTSEYGPPVQVIPTSGLTGQGLDELIEGLVLQSEIMDLRADDEARAEGIVMDARIEKGLGVVADCIIRWGSIEKGDIIVSGTQASRVRLLKDVNGQVLKRGMPSQPVRIVGFKSLPKAGDPILCVESQEVADEMVEQRAAVNDDEVIDRTINADEVEIHINGMRRRDTRRVAKFHELAGLEEGDGTIRIPIVVKADADGSLSAIRDSLVSLGAKSSHKVIVDPIQEGIGEITASDIQMAKESEACIFAFGLKRIDPAMLNLAESEGVVIKSNDIIYALLDEAKETLGKYLPPQPVEHVHGRGSIQAIFVVDGESGEEKVAGLRVMDGFLYKEKSSNDLRCHFRVYRSGTLISPDSTSVTAASLRKFKEQVQSVRRGEECGLTLSGFEDFQEGDEIECYSVEMKSPTL